MPKRFDKTLVSTMILCPRGWCSIDASDALYTGNNVYSLKDPGCCIVCDFSFLLIVLKSIRLSLVLQYLCIQGDDHSANMKC